MKALVIDDSRAMRMILRALLMELGYDVIEAQDGRQALELMSKPGSVDLAMVDWNMPEMNGYEFVQAVRADPAFNATLLVMCTTETEMHQVQKALVAGANEYVMKPFTADVIREKLALLGMAA